MSTGPTTFNFADIWEAMWPLAPERTALVCGTQRRTYEELAGRVNRLAHHLDAAGVGPGDHVGLFAFDRRLTELAPFGARPDEVLDALARMQPFGVTSLFDAIAETGETLAAHAGTHRAVVVLTDGVDNASAMSSTRVSAIANSVDVPVYLLLISPALDRAGRAQLDDTSLDEAQQSRLSDLARWTGGESFVASTPQRSRTATREIVTELRHQYVIVFTPDPRPGWHGIEIKTREKDLIVRARSGYTVESRPDGQ